MKSQLPQLPIARLDGTYLAWVDVSSITMDTERLCARLRADEKVWVNPGEMYGCQGFLRVNLAAPRQLVEAGTRRLIRGLNEKK